MVLHVDKLACNVKLLSWIVLKNLIYLAFSNYIVCIVLPTPGLLVRLMFATKGIVLHFSFSVFQTYSQAKVHLHKTFSLTLYEVHWFIK